MHIIAIIAFALILISLGSALVFLLVDRGTTKRMVYSLTFRIGLSVALFLFILIANYFGWIHSTGRLY